MNASNQTVSGPIISAKANQLFTSSLDVAEKFGKLHKNVLQAIADIECSDKFSRLNFQPRDYTDYRGKVQPMFHITRDGFTFLAMGFRGKRAAEWKEKYISAFNTMEAAIARQSNLSWQDQRQQGKVARREVTDTIKEFVAYAERQGSKHASYYFKHITAATYKALFLVQCNAGQSFRDLLDSMQLSFLTTAEFVAARAISEGMELSLPYKEIYQLAKDRIESLALAIPKTPVISAGFSIVPAMQTVEAR